jgi:hypothetical protein
MTKFIIFPVFKDKNEFKVYFIDLKYDKLMTNKYGNKKSRGKEGNKFFLYLFCQIRCIHWAEIDSSLLLVRNIIFIWILAICQQKIVKNYGGMYDVCALIGLHLHCAKEQAKTMGQNAKCRFDQSPCSNLLKINFLL